MILEALSPSCFSNLYVLKLDGRPWGEYHGRWFSESVDIRVSGRRNLVLEKVGWMGWQFKLTDTADGRVLATAQRAGAFTSAWDLRFGNEPARLVSAGWLNWSYNLAVGGRHVAGVTRVGACNGGWVVQHHGEPAPTDLLFTGMIFHTILRRNAAAATVATT
jgi:hypothetical protein